MASALGHLDRADDRAKGAVDMALARSMAPPVVVGVVLGAIVARYSDGAILNAVWIVCAILISLKLFLGAGWNADGLAPGCASHDITLSGIPSGPKLRGAPRATAR